MKDYSKTYFKDFFKKTISENVTGAENFYNFLKNKLKKEYKNGFDFSAYFDELAEKYGATGFPEYELSPFESESGCPELFSFEVEEIEDNDGDFTIKYIL